MNDKTEFTDKTGKPIYIGDIVQIRLGKFAKKSAGPSTFCIIRSGKRVCLIPSNQEPSQYGNLRLTEQLTKNMVVIVHTNH
ncbi:MAG TPA: hypothetical protein VFT59_02545 [Candidatus Saccharimonadales bacterium]|nr:hypothetical protein [Candidatus Saccharimonadales bacterium]